MQAAKPATITTANNNANNFFIFFIKITSLKFFVKSLCVFIISLVDLKLNVIFYSKCIKNYDIYDLLC